MSTLAEHMPTRHQKQGQWNAKRLVSWAQSIGENTKVLVETLILQKKHEEQAYRVCLGLLNLAKTYTAKRLDDACFIANKSKIYRLKQIKNILKTNQDKLVVVDDHDKQLSLLSQSHENIRGPKSFH